MGNLYVVIADTEKAKRAYENCLAIFNGRHTDCQNSLDGLGNGKPNAERYRQVSQIIQGKARWQDFTEQERAKP